MRRFLIGLGVVAASVATPLWAAGLDEDTVRKALLERFDENRNDKLEPVEAKQARTRMRNLLEDKSEREINIHTWRDDVKPLLMTLDPDEDRRLTDKERSAAVAMLERLIPKVTQDEGRGKEQSSVGLSSGERKRESGSRRSSGQGYRSGSGSGGYGGIVGPWTMGGGGWGMNRNYGLGSGTPIGGSSLNSGNSFNSGSSSFVASSSNAGFFSGSGSENTNPAKGDLRTAESQNATKAADTDQARRRNSDFVPLADCPMGAPAGSSSSDPGTTADGHPGKDKPGSPAVPPDRLAGGVDTTGTDDTPKRGATPGPKLIPPVPKPGF